MFEIKILLTLALSEGATGTEPREPAPPPYTYPSPAETISTPIGRVAWPVGSQDTAPVEREYWPELHLYTPPEGRGFVWARDGWGSRALEYDKVEHVAGGYAGLLTLRATGLSPARAVASVAALALLWEIKDGFYNPENFPGHDNYFLGDGFSWKDWVATLAGTAVAWGLWEVCQ